MADIEKLIADVDACRAMTPCDVCKGTGECPIDKGDPCYKCKGEGENKEYWPRVVTALEFPDQEEMLNARTLFSSHKPGEYVAVRPCSENRTFLGIYLGDFASSMSARIDETGSLTLSYSLGNPSIWVPDLARIVRGYESWWGAIEGPEQLREITNNDIENVWYVQALKAMAEPSPSGDSE